MTGGDELRYVVWGDEAATLPRVLRSRAEATPDARFVTCAQQSVSYHRALERAEQAASALAAIGVRRGNTVVVMLPNCLEFLDLWFGCALIGAPLVPVNLGLRGDGLRYIVNHSDADVAIIDESVRDAFESALPLGTGPRLRLIRADEGEHSNTLNELLSGAHPRPCFPESKPGDIASILYTSGTTGPPKGVLNCHNSYVTAGLEFTSTFVRTRADDVFYTSLPLFHVNAQMLTTIGSVISGRPMILAPRFTASGFIDDLRLHNVTVFNYIGAMLTMIAKQPERPDDEINPARLAVGGAAPAELWTKFERRFGLTILEIYGLTETATFCLGSPPDDIRPGTIGVPVSWSDVKLLDDKGQEARIDEPGEISIRAKRPDVLFKGYYKDADATARSMENGWFRSGDRGIQRADGYFVFVDRLKDVIRRRGENISSFEVERIVNTHPLVAASAAVGVPSELGEDDVMIHVVTQDGAYLSPADLIEFCEQRMARFMVPRYVMFRDELPKTATERVQKYALRREGANGAWDRETSL